MSTSKTQLSLLIPFSLLLIERFIPALRKLAVKRYIAAKLGNIGYLVDESVYHPGDSFTVPTSSVSTLLAPLHAPWSKLSEVVDFAVSVRAPRTLNLHDSLLTDIGRNMVEGQVGRIAGAHGTEFVHLAPGETLTV